MLKIVGILVAIVAVGIAGILAYAATKPDTFRVQRAASIKAPPEKIFPLLNNLRAFALWSPYEKKDPRMQRTYSGASLGKGAVYEWDGDKNVGSGRLAIADSSPPSKVTLHLDMMRPLEAHNVVEFTLEPNGAVHPRDVGDERPGALHRQDRARVPQRRQHGRQGFRGRPRRSEGAGREMIGRAHAPATDRDSQQSRILAARRSPSCS